MSLTRERARGAGARPGQSSPALSRRPALIGPRAAFRSAVPRGVRFCIACNPKPMSMPRITSGKASSLPHCC